VVACLRRPRAEVWPGPAALACRWAMALVTGWPGAGDLALGAAKRRAERA
jgi:hypothetical protein